MVRPETDPLFNDISSFLALSKELNSDQALRLSMSETKRRQRESRWQYKAINALQIAQSRLGLDGFTSRRFGRMMRIVEADVNRALDPILAPVLNPLITVMSQ